MHSLPVHQIEARPLALVLAPYALFNAQTPFPGMAAAPSVLGASLIILYGTQNGLNQLLSSKPAVWVGKISYSLYLWHWPIFVLLGSTGSFKRAVAGIIATLLATLFSYYFIELPIRRRKSFGKRHAFTMLIGGSSIIAILCLSISAQKSKIGQLDSIWGSKPTWVMAELARDKSRSSCQIEDLNKENSKYLIKIGKTNAPPLLLYGGTVTLWL